MLDLPQDKAHFTTEEAARLFGGISVEFFLELVGEYGAGWCRPTWIGKKGAKRKVKHWHKDDLMCLDHIWHHWREEETVEAVKNPKEISTAD